MLRLPPQLLRQLHSDEYAAVPYDQPQRAVAHQAAHSLPGMAQRLNDRRATALSLELLNRAHGQIFYELERDASTDQAAAAASFAGLSPVIDVQTHIVDEKLWTGPMASALSTFNAMVDPDRWRDGMDPRMADASM